MREVLIKQWCDVCASVDDGRTEATATFAVTIFEDGVDRIPTRRLELCDGHAKEVRLVAALARDLGAAPDTSPIAPPIKAKAHRVAPAVVHTCRVCGKEYGSDAGLFDHVRTVHLGEPRGVRRPVLTVCPDCGDESESPQGLSSHRKTQHGTGLLADLYAEVEALAKPRRARK